MNELQRTENRAGETEQDKDAASEQLRLPGFNYEPSTGEVLQRLWLRSRKILELLESVTVETVELSRLVATLETTTRQSTSDQRRT